MIPLIRASHTESSPLQLCSHFHTVHLTCSTPGEEIPHSLRKFPFSIPIFPKSSLHLSNVPDKIGFSFFLQPTEFFLLTPTQRRKLPPCPLWRCLAPCSSPVLHSLCWYGINTTCSSDLLHLFYTLQFRDLSYILKYFYINISVHCHSAQISIVIW